MNNIRILKKLHKLRKYGYVNASFFESTAFFKDVLENLLARLIVQKFPARQKGGWQYRLLNMEALNKVIEFYEKQPVAPKTRNKVEATRLTGNAHTANESKYPSLPLRVGRDNALVFNGNKMIDAYSVCKAGAALYIPINPALNTWQLEGSISLIENQHFFWEIDTFYVTDYYLYLQGNYSNRILEWLASPGMRIHSFIYFGDYDPTGIKLYLRIKERLPNCEFFIPDNFEELLEKYGNDFDLTKQHRDFNKLLEYDDPGIVYLREMFEKTGKTLHQEALLI